MNRQFTSLFVSVIAAFGAALGSPYAAAQSQGASPPPGPVQILVHPEQQLSRILALPPPRLPRMPPKLALATYEWRAQQQSSTLAAYSDFTVIEAGLPDSSQHAVYELRRRYRAPSTLEFSPVSFVGDDFVKHNVIVRLLQSEAQHVKEHRGSRTAITNSNYTFKYKSVEELDSHPVYMFEVKPRQKRPGLFKGLVFIDIFTGTLRRAEGSLVKSPSLFIKKVHFVQDYEDVGGFTLPAHLRSVAIVHFLGHTVIDVFHRNYQTTSFARLNGLFMDVQTTAVPMGLHSASSTTGETPALEESPF